MTEILGYTRHPASAVWPDLSEEEYAALRKNIEAQGQDHPILVTEQMQVIDGWHRLRACAEIDLYPTVTVCQFEGPEIAQKINGAHAGRRHLTKLDMALYVVQTIRACGAQFPDPRGGRLAAPQNDRIGNAGSVNAEGDGENDSEKHRKVCGVSERAPTIDPRIVAQEADVSVRTAESAIARAREIEEPPSREALAAAVKRRAEAAAKRAARAKPLEEQLSFWKESNEMLSAELAEARARLAEVAGRPGRRDHGRGRQCRVQASHGRAPQGQPALPPGKQSAARAARGSRGKGRALENLRIPDRGGFAEPRMTYEKRQYQTDAINGFFQAVRESNRRVMLCSPTGSGKSVMAMRLCDHLLKHGRRVNFIVDRTVLVEQISDEFDRFRLPHGVTAGPITFGRSEPLMVRSAQTMRSRDIDPNDADLKHRR